ncbi:hypothetical protein C8J56DRAFT_1024175 [Mycena floridula]|nr:hypothetical protein C8J56DRAFT_1024175 [Mycena floridula]
MSDLASETDSLAEEANEAPTEGKSDSYASPRKTAMSAFLARGKRVVHSRRSLLSKDSVGSRLPRRPPAFDLSLAQRDKPVAVLSGYYDPIELSSDDGLDFDLPVAKDGPIRRIGRDPMSRATPPPDSGEPISLLPTNPGHIDTDEEEVIDDEKVQSSRKPKPRRVANPSDNDEEELLLVPKPRRAVIPSSNNEDDETHHKPDPPSSSSRKRPALSMSEAMTLLGPAKRQRTGSASSSNISSAPQNAPPQAATLSSVSSRVPSVDDKTATWLHNEAKARPGWETLLASHGLSRPNPEIVQNWKFIVDFMEEYKGKNAPGSTRPITVLLLKMVLGITAQRLRGARDGTRLVQRFGSGGPDEDKEVVERLALTEIGGTAPLLAFLTQKEKDFIEKEKEMLEEDKQLILKAEEQAPVGVAVV